MELSRHIKDILINRDNVIIPGFGGFEKSMVSASIDEKTGEMKPPHTSIIFRNELKTDSGVLVKYIVEKEKLSEDKVTEDLKKQVEAWQNSLNSGKNVLLNGLGMLYKDDSGTIVFQASINPSDFPESYGLPVITIKEKSLAAQQTTPKNVESKKTVKKAPPKKKAPVKKQIRPKSTSETKGDKKVSKSLIIGLVIGIPMVALIVLGALNFNFVKQKFNDTTNFVSSLISGDRKKDTTTVADGKIDTLSQKDSADIETEAILENYTIINAETNTKVEPKMKELSEVKKVHIIAGSFKVKSFAQRHRNNLNRKGFKAEVLPKKNGLFRVSVGSFDNIGSAVNDFERIKSIDENLSIWILVK